jgi:hypothetical protein
MAQYIFDASKYPNGTLISELEWWKSLYNPLADYEVVEIGSTGRKYWQEVATTTSKSMTSQTTYTDYEILLLKDFVKSENVGATYHGYGFTYFTAEGGTNVPIFSKVEAILDNANSLSYTVSKPLSTNDYTKNDPPTGLLNTQAMGMRFQLSNLENIKVRTWAANVGALETDEPAVWDCEVDLGQASPVASYLATPYTAGTGYQSRFSCISVGTDGDTAQYPNPSVVLAATPSAPTVTNMSATTATVDWG